MRVLPLIGLLMLSACVPQQQPGTTSSGNPSMAAFRGPDKSAAEFVGDHLFCANAAAPNNYNLYNQCMLAHGHIPQVAGTAANTAPAPTAAVTRIGAETGGPTSADDFRAAMTDMHSGNYAEAMLLFRKIDAGQDITAQAGRETYQETLSETRTSIGDMYEMGQGVPQDFKAARYWYQKAIDTGGFTGRASAQLARLYEQGLGGPKDHQKYLQLDPVQVVKEQEAEERRKNEALMSGLAAAAARHGPSSYQQCKDRCWDEAKLCNAGSFVGGKAFPTPSNLSFTCSLPYSLCTAGCR
jgi:hypothetical protein